MNFIFGAIGFEGMGASKRAEYLHETFKLGINTQTGKEVTGGDVLLTLVSLDFALNQDGFIDRPSLLKDVITKLGAPEPHEDALPNLEEAVINVMLAVDMLDFKKGRSKRDKSGYVPATDISMFQAVLLELSRIGY